MLNPKAVTAAHSRSQCSAGLLTGGNLLPMRDCLAVSGGEIAPKVAETRTNTLASSQSRLQLG